MSRISWGFWQIPVRSFSTSVRSFPTSVRSWRTSVRSWRTSVRSRSTSMRSSWISVRSRCTSVLYEASGLRCELAVASLVTITETALQFLCNVWRNNDWKLVLYEIFSNDSNRAEVVVKSSFGWRNNTWRYQANESSCRSSAVNISTYVWDGYQQGETRSE